jgi:hypothetical protein
MSQRFGIFPILFLLFGCLTCQKQVENIDGNARYAFHRGDTLVYEHYISADTFVIKEINDYLTESDKKSIEVVNITILKINKDCYLNCDRMEIFRTHNSFSLLFRNMDYAITINTNSDSLITYKIGSHLTKNVYKLTANTSTGKLSDLKTIYYSVVYGILAYEQYNGDIYKLEEKYF